ncbi:MAG: hypothetical protein RIR49_1704 [Actinomycetota bacterium]|jgi:LysM repeat protein
MSIIAPAPLAPTFRRPVGPSAARPHLGKVVAHRAPMRRPVSPAVYRRRRLVVGTVLAVAVVAGGLAINEVLAGDGGVTASASAAEPVPARTTVTAQPGDTLWAIAQTHRGEVDVRRYLDRLIALNGGASIQAGQAIVLP